jgi:hypothetical protein
MTGTYLELKKTSLSSYWNKPRKDKLHWCSNSISPIDISDLNLHFACFLYVKGTPDLTRRTAGLVLTSLPSRPVLGPRLSWWIWRRWRYFSAKIRRAFVFVQLPSNCHSNPPGTVPLLLLIINTLRLPSFYIYMTHQFFTTGWSLVGTSALIYYTPCIGFIYRSAASSTWHVLIKSTLLK